MFSPVLISSRRRLTTDEKLLAKIPINSGKLIVVSLYIGPFPSYHV